MTKRRRKTKRKPVKRRRMASGRKHRKQRSGVASKKRPRARKHRRKQLSGQAAADAQLAWSRSKGNYSVSAIKVVDGKWYRKYGKTKYWSNGLGGQLEYRNGKMYYVHSGKMDKPSNYDYDYVD